jgi:4-hydroxy-3-polyprenylbenzoate decarboxylase
MSGASGAAYGVKLLEVLRELGYVTHLVASDAAKRTLTYETARKWSEVTALASVVHNIDDVGASIASGSFQNLGMVIIPCSVRTAAAVAYCNADNLLTRAADVVLKERRRLVLVLRETPLHLGHLRMLTVAAEAGAVIMPPVPAFYVRPKTLDDIVTHTVGRVLDHLGIEHDLLQRWGEPEPEEES